MKINTALILCAGYGKRLNPITLDTPKPLLELHNVTILEKGIQLIKSLGIKKILINSFYLKDHFFLSFLESLLLLQKFWLHLLRPKYKVI